MSSLLCSLFVCLLVALSYSPDTVSGHRFRRPARNLPKSTSSSQQQVSEKIPPVEDAARMARYIVHNSDWCVLSHITHQRNATGYPMGRVFSTSDGVPGVSTGTPYFYTSDLDGVARDLETDNRCALTMSLIQGEYCKQEKLDPENPRCAQVMLIGHFIYLKNQTDEWNFAKKVLFSRHPEMDSWPKTHNFKFARFAVSNVQIVDYFGGSKYPTVAEYYAANPIESKVTTEEDDSFMNSIYRVHLI